MLKVSELAIYPVKSCAQIRVQSAKVDDFGLHMDRRWMVVDEQGKFLTQRQLPRMCLIEPTLYESGISLQAPAMEACRVDINNLSQTFKVTVWADQCSVLDCGNVAATWLTAFLETKCRLVYFPESEIRQVDLDYAQQGIRTAFSDGFPLLLISEASLGDLNDRLARTQQQSVEMRRFRPNIVVSGCEAFAEDSWQKIQIGDMVLSIVKPCSRCVIPSIDPDTGIRGDEPTQTLKSYRRKEHPKIGNKIFFGQNVIAENFGQIEVGLPVKILEAIEV